MDAAEPKIACRNLWKLFGPGAEAFLARQRGAARGLTRSPPRASSRR